MHLVTISDYHNHPTTVLWPFFWDHPGQPVPEENFWTYGGYGKTKPNTTKAQSGTLVPDCAISTVRHTVLENQIEGLFDKDSRTGKSAVFFL